MPKKFPHVEDYIEVMNGDRHPVTGKTYGMFDNTAPIINLARYDVQVLASMSTATVGGNSLTDRQAALAVKLILKYKKQLDGLGIDVSPVEQPQFRYTLRQIDRRKLADVTDDHIVLKFPYEVKMINDLRDLAKTAAEAGRWAFDNASKTWQLGLTEPNVIAAYGFAQKNQFEISAEFEKLNQTVLDCEAVPYRIELTIVDGQCSIVNAAPGLIGYINNWCGFDIMNLDLLVDIAPVLGYTVDPAILSLLADKYSTGVCNLMTSRVSKFSAQVDHLAVQDVIRYAEVVGRTPVYVYEPDLSGRLFDKFVAPNFDHDQIYQTTTLKHTESAEHKKVIYFNKFHPSWQQPIPLLISGHGMMYGGERSILLQRAEKVVYFATEVYNGKVAQRRAQ